MADEPDAVRVVAVSYGDDPEIGPFVLWEEEGVYHEVGWQAFAHVFSHRWSEELVVCSDGLLGVRMRAGDPRREQWRQPPPEIRRKIAAWLLAVAL